MSDHLLAPLPTAHKHSDFKIKTSKDKYENFTRQFPLYKFEAWKLYELVAKARETNMGGNFEDCTFDSLIRAFTDTHEHKDKYRKITDEL